jgi:hypothetical protein
VRRDAATIAAAALTIGGAAVLLVAGRDTWLYLDEWDFATRADQLSAESIFYPQNQNLHATVVLIYRALFELFGLDGYLPFRLLATALVVCIAVLGYVYARRRIGPWWALLPLALLVSSPAYEVMLWPFQMGQLLSGAAGLGALVLLDREPTRATRVAAAALLVIAVTSSSAGVPLVAVVVYDRLLTAGRRLEALVALPAAAVYAWWYWDYGDREPRANEFTAAAVNAAARRAIDIGDGAVQSVLGLGSRGTTGALLGQVGLLVLVILVCWRLFSPYSSGRGRVIALAGGLVTYWFLLAWGRPFQAGLELSGRYLFLSQILMVLLLVEVGRGVADWARDERARRGEPVRVAGAVAGAAVVIVGGLALLHNVRTELDFGKILRDNERAMRGQVYGLFLLPEDRRDGAPFFLEALGRQIPRSGAQLFSIIDRFGGPDPTEADVRALPADARGRADQALLGTYAVPAASATAGPPPAVTVVAGDADPLRQSGSCVTVRAQPGGSLVADVQAPPAGFSVMDLGEEPLGLLARRYAPTWDGPARVDVAPQSALDVRPAPDRGTQAWSFRLEGQAGRVCSLAP